MKHSGAAALLMLLAAGCSYTSKPMHPENIRTIHLPIFDNRTFRRTLEFDLTRAIKTELLHKSDFRLADRESADTELSGEIVDIRENVLLEDLNDDTVQTSVTVTVDLIWRDLRTGRILLNRKGFSDTAELTMVRGENIGTATEEAFRDLAERVVDLLEEDW